MVTKIWKWQYRVGLILVGIAWLHSLELWALIVGAIGFSCLVGFLDDLVDALEAKGEAQPPAEKPEKE